MPDPQEVHRPKNGATPRIPIALQTVFLDGNRGIVVNTPTPNTSTTKTFFRKRWWGRSQPATNDGAKGAVVNNKKPKRIKKKKVKSSKYQTNRSISMVYSN